MDVAAVVALGIAEIADLVCILTVLVMWRRHRRTRRVDRLRHPSAPPPVTVHLVRDRERLRLRASVRDDVPPTSIDIVSFRPTGTDEEWTNAPLIDPMRIGTGGWALVPSSVDTPAESVDVVVAWTVHHQDGDVPGSRTFKVSAGESAADDIDVFRRPGRASLPSLPAVALLVVLAATAAVVGAALWSEIEGDASGADAAALIR